MLNSSKMLELKDIRFKSRGKIILDGIDLKIRKGEKILIKGESGSGKTSLLKSILFFNKFTGKIIYNDEEIGIENIDNYRTNIGYVGQKIPNFRQAVKRFLRLPRDFKHNKNLKIDEEIIQEYLKKLNFDKEILNGKFNELSGGERQRIALISVLLLKRPFYIFDEISSALDKNNIRSLIALITDDTEKTVVSVSHNIEWEDFCNRIIIMDGGKIIEDKYI